MGPQDLTERNKPFVDASVGDRWLSPDQKFVTLDVAPRLFGATDNPASTVRDFQSTLVHEAAHVLDLGNPEGSTWKESFTEALRGDNGETMSRYGAVSTFVPDRLTEVFAESFDSSITSMAFHTSRVAPASPFRIATAHANTRALG